jgi:hypothetical protein
VSHVAAWTDREVEMLAEGLAPYALEVFNKGLARGRLAREAFGVQSLAPLLDCMVDHEGKGGPLPYCGLCLEPEERCVCHRSEFAQRMVTGREDWE